MEICSQIVILQCVFYLAVGFSLFFSNVLLGTDLDLDYVFSSRDISFTSSFSYPAIVSFLLTAPVNAVALAVVVGRARKCLDYGSTVYLLHLLVCTLAHGFPSTAWWVLSVGGCVITVVMGECLCMRREMQSIPTHVYGGDHEEEESVGLVGGSKFSA